MLIHANIVTATFSKETISKLSGCAYIKSGGRMGRRNDSGRFTNVIVVPSSTFTLQKNQMNIKQYWRYMGNAIQIGLTRLLLE